MGDLLSRAGNTMGAHNFNTLQQELRRQRNAYGKVRHGHSDSTSDGDLCVFLHIYNANSATYDATLLLLLSCIKQ